MSARQLVRLAVLLALVLAVWGGAALLRHGRRDRGASLVWPVIDTSAVDTVAFTRSGDSAVLVRGADKRWRVNGFPASTDNVGQLLAALGDRATWSELAAESAGSHEAMGVAADSGQRVRVVGKGGVEVDLITGHRTADGGGLFVRRPGRDTVYALHGAVPAAFGHSVDEWRDRTIASVPLDSVARVEVTHGTHSYALFRIGRAWRYVSGEPADSGAVRMLVGRFSPLVANSFATAAQADSARFTHPTVRVRLYAEGATPTMDLLMDSTKTAVWVRADTGKTVYSIDSWQVPDLAPPESMFRLGRPKAR